MQLSVLEQQYILHHGAMGHSSNTISHYEDTFRLFDRFITDTGKSPTTILLATPVMNEFAMWLRITPTKGWRGDTKRTEAGMRGIMTDMRAFVRWGFEEGHLDELPKVPVNKLPQVFFPILSDKVGYRAVQAGGPDKGIGELPLAWICLTDRRMQPGG